MSSLSSAVRPVIGHRVVRADRIAPVEWAGLAAVALIIGIAAVVGALLNAHGVHLVLPAPPLIASWSPHLGWGSPLATATMIIGLRLRSAAATLSWPRLLTSGWLIAAAWLAGLALIDGLTTGWADVLLNPNEYLHDLPRITSAAGFLRGFTAHIVDGPGAWTTHVAGHPPLITLIFWWLDRIGLPGGFWAGTLCIAVSSTVVVSLPSAVRSLGAEGAARRLVPFLALFPGAVWMAVSADGLFAGLGAAGLAVVCAALRRRSVPLAAVGGLLLGALLLCSYGMAVYAVIVLAAIVLAIARPGRRRIRDGWPVVAAVALGVVTVLAGFALLGFDWFTGLRLLRVRYLQGIAADRPYWYFLFADPAAWAISCSPLLAIAVVRAVRSARSHDRDELVPAVLTLAAVAAATIADLSGMSKAETERIWLPFGVVAASGFALLRGRAAGLTLAGCAATAILVNHLLATGW